MSGQCRVPGCNCDGFVHGTGVTPTPGWVEQSGPSRPQPYPDDSWENKCWGRVRHLFDHPGAAISHLETTQGHRCSCHFHHHRSNLFHVISGEIEIVHFLPASAGDDTGAHSVRQVKVCPNQQYVVPCRHVHWFRVLESGEVIELYWRCNSGDVAISDIVRYDAGGEDNSSWLIESRDRINQWHRDRLREFAGA